MQGGYDKSYDRSADLRGRDYEKALRREGRDGGAVADTGAVVDTGKQPRVPSNVDPRCGDVCISI